MSLPIRVRLTLWYGALLALALALFAGTVYVVMANALLANLDTAMAGRLDHVVAEARIVHGRPVLPRDEEPVDVPLIPVGLIGPAGAVIDGPLPRYVRPSTLPHASRTRHFETVGTLRVATAPIIRRNHLIGTAVVWQSQRAVNDARRTLLLLMLGTGPALLLVALLGGFALASRALRPVTTLTHTAAAISATDLSRRVSVGVARDEVSDLAVTFNAMIDRLEGAVERERRFTADASHELRSPLAIIRAEATLALERTRPPDEYRRVLQVIDEQAAGIEDLIGALLALARAESASEQIGAYAISDLVDEAVAGALTANGTVRVQSEIPGTLRVEGSGTLLTRALRNIIDNAIRFSPPAGQVRIRARRDAAVAVIEIEDDGPGIALEHQERVFEPFYQVQAARTPGASHGLGLSICRRIVEAHGGVLTLLPRQGKGAVFRIELPAV